MLDNLTINLRLARRLAPAVCFRYRALAVAEDNGRITVAMANPDDEAAREAVAAALREPLCIVESDPGSIETALAEIWPEHLRPFPRVLVCAQGRKAIDEVTDFARAASNLLEAQVSFFRPETQAYAACDDLIHEVVQGHYDLVMYIEPEKWLDRGLFSRSAHREIREGLSASLLVVRRPRWPLRHLLLFIQDEERHNPAMDWVVCLARLSAASVTVLTVVPPVPALYSHQVCTQQGLDALLTTNTSLGRQMRRVAQWLVDWDVQSTLRLRQGMPDQEIHHEVAQGDYDLIALADRPSEWWRRSHAKDWVASVLSWADRPVLVAKGTME